MISFDRYIKEQNDVLESSLLQERKQDQREARMVKMGIPLPPDQNNDNLASDLSLDEEIQMAQQVGSLTSFMNSELNSLSGIREKIASYELMFEQLKKMTGVESLEDMVTNYSSHEEEMFSLYNFIQAVNAEIDTVVEATIRTENDIKKFQEDQYDQDQQRRSLLDELQQRLSSTVELTRTLEETNLLQQESVSQISKKVSSLFFKLQCDQMDSKNSSTGNAKSGQKWTSSTRPESKVSLLTGQGVSESNVLDYLGCIEQRAVDIISEYLRAQSNNNIHHHHKGLTHNNRSPTPGPSSPTNWFGANEPFINLDELSDDDLLDGIESSTNANDNDKPVDLRNFKTKLQKKMGIKEVQSSSNIFGSMQKSKKDFSKTR